MMPPAWNLVLLHLRVRISVCVNPEMDIARIRGRADNCLLSKVNTLNKEMNALTGVGKSFAPIPPKGKSLGSHMGGWEYLAHPDTPYYERGCTRKATHPSTIPIVSGLPSDFPWDPAQDCGFKPPLALCHLFVCLVTKELCCMCRMWQHSGKYEPCPLSCSSRMGSSSTRLLELTRMSWRRSATNMPTAVPRWRLRHNLQRGHSCCCKLFPCKL